MRKFLLLFFSLLVVQLMQGQILVNLQLPVIGLSTKNQLWNMILVNPGTETIRVRVNLLFTDETTGQAVMTATTAEITLLSGSHVFQPSDFMPVTYNIVNNSYGIDANPNGFLPVGHFNVCYQFERFVSDSYERLIEECERVEIEPVSPPQLIFPEDGGTIEYPQPVFSWLPPAPINFFSQLTFDLRLVKIEGSQLPTDAIQQNIPLLSQRNITNLSFPYPSSFPQLDTGVVYAWQIVVNNNNQPVAQSDVWTFKVGHFGPAEEDYVNGRPFARLKNPATSPVNYFLCSGNLLVGYENYLVDDTVKVAMYDLTQQQQPITLDSNYIIVKSGLNLIELKLADKGSFIDDHVYVFEIINSRQERWIGKFYMKREEEEGQGNH